LALKATEPVSELEILGWARPTRYPGRKFAESAETFRVN
ncbi:unnamed protein product, partial [Heterotrigona itama]